MTAPPPGDHQGPLARHLEWIEAVARADQKDSPGPGKPRRVGRRRRLRRPIRPLSERER
jgi:hypothetical protein